MQIFYASPQQHQRIAPNVQTGHAPQRARVAWIDTGPSTRLTRKNGQRTPNARNAQTPGHRKHRTRETQASTDHCRRDETAPGDGVNPDHGERKLTHSNVNFICEITRDKGIIADILRISAMTSTHRTERSDRKRGNTGGPSLGLTLGPGHD